MTTLYLQCQRMRDCSLQHEIGNQFLFDVIYRYFLRSVSHMIRDLGLSPLSSATCYTLNIPPLAKFRLLLHIDAIIESSV